MGTAKWPQTLTAVVTFAQAACPCLDGRPQAGVAGDVTRPPSLLGARPTGGRALRPLCPRGPAFLTVHCCRRGHRGPIKTPPVMGAGWTHGTPQDPCPWNAGCQLPREGTPWWWALAPTANSRNSRCLRPGRSSGAAPQEVPCAGRSWASVGGACNGPRCHGGHAPAGVGSAGGEPCQGCTSFTAVVKISI